VATVVLCLLSDQWDPTHTRVACRHQRGKSMTRYTGFLGIMLAIISAAAGWQVRPSQAGQPGMQQPGMPPGVQQSGRQNATAPQTAGGVGGAATNSANGGTSKTSGTQTGQAPGSSTPGQNGNTQQPAGETRTDTELGASDLAGQIETALHDNPTLANDQISVNVTDTDVVVSGTVGNGKEKETVKRIAESFATNRRVVDKVKVSGSKNTRSDQTRPN
jgi:osmotically-inducible protein OsmY